MIETNSLIIFIFALFSQYLNLYRSVWWLPRMRGNQSVNFHLIDTDAAQFSLSFLGQTYMLCIARATFYAFYPRSGKARQQTHTQQNNSHQNNHHTTISNSCTVPNNTHNNLNNNNHSNTNSTSIITTCLTTLFQPLLINHSNQQNHISDRNNITSEATIIVTNLITLCISWGFNLKMVHIAYKIWYNYGLNGLSCITYPMVSMCDSVNRK